MFAFNDRDDERGKECSKEHRERVGFMSSDREVLCLIDERLMC